MPQSPSPQRPPPDDEEHARLCKRLLEQLRRHCPELVPEPPPRPGGLAAPVKLGRETLGGLLRAALAPEAGQPTVVWRDADSEVALHTAETRVAVRDGIVAVSLLLECQETDGTAEVVVPFAVGAEQRPAGMIAATERRPRGPAILVDRWGEAIVAAAWQALLDIATAAASGAGDDIDGQPLRAGALLAGDETLVVVPQARHEFEREAGS